MNGVGFEIVARTRVPQLPLSYPFPPPPPPPHPPRARGGAKMVETLRIMVNKLGSAQPYKKKKIAIKSILRLPCRPPMFANACDTGVRSSTVFFFFFFRFFLARSRLKSKSTRYFCRSKYSANRNKLALNVCKHTHARTHTCTFDFLNYIN